MKQNGFRSASKNYYTYIHITSKVRHFWSNGSKNRWQRNALLV